MIGKQQLMRELCGIVYIAQKHYKFKHQADCFCGVNLLTFEEPMTNMIIVDFIREAVQEKVERETNAL